MIFITDPEGPNAARTLCDGMLAVAAIHGYQMNVVMCANVSLLTAMAREFPDSRINIAAHLRDALAVIESGQFPTSDQPLGRAAAGQHLH